MWTVWLAMMIGCSGDDTGGTDDTTVPGDDDDDSAGDDDDDDVTGPTAHTADTSVEDTSPTGDTGTGWVVDCAAISPTPTGSTLLPTLSAYHGLAFDENGYFYGSSGNTTVVQWDIYGAFSVIAANVGWMEQFDYDITTGMLYVAAGSEILEIHIATGAQRTVGNVSAYGVKVGPDGFVYAGDNNNLYRIDPVNAVQGVLISQNGPRIMEWSPDGSKLYYGQLSGGRLYSVDLDANYDPIGPPVVLASNFGSYMDGLTVDICGNIYVASYANSAMFRVEPDGTKTTLMDPSLTFYGHGVQFGRGIGGWLEDALYVPQPYNNSTVSEVIIGVPHRDWPGTVINLP